MGDFDKLIVAKGFKKLSKVQKIARSGHTDHSFSIQHPKEMEILFLVKAIHTETFSLFSWRFGQNVLLVWGSTLFLLSLLKNEFLSSLQCDQLAWVKSSPIVSKISNHRNIWTILRLKWFWANFGQYFCHWGLQKLTKWRKTAQSGHTAHLFNVGRGNVHFKMLLCCNFCSNHLPLFFSLAHNFPVTF